MQITRPIQLLQSAAVEVPTLLGALKPVILLPASALTGLSADQLTALLAHELAHIRRHDYLANILQSCIETLLFYHPAIWWLGRRIRLEREHCCDDTAVALTSSPLTYAQALAAMESLRTPSSLTLAATGPSRGTLLKRIQRLLSGPAAPAKTPRRLVSAWAALALIAAASLIYIGCNRSTPAPTTTTTTDTAPATIATSGNTHTYDIRYLLGPVANKEASQKAAQDIIDTIRATVAPETWKQNGGTADIHISDGKLAITQSPENLRKIDDLLDQLFQTRGLAVAVETRAIIVSKNFLDDFRIGYNLTIPLRDASQTAPASNASIIDNWTLNLLLTATQADKRTVTFSPPRTDVPNGYPFEVKISTPSVATGNTVPLWNTGDDAVEALYLRATPTTSADRRYVVLSDLQFRTITSMLTASSTSPRAASGPGTNVARINDASKPDTIVSVPDGGTLLINGGPISSTIGGPPDRILLLLVRPNLIIHTEAIFPRTFDNHVGSRPATQPPAHSNGRQVLIKSTIIEADARDVSNELTKVPEAGGFANPTGNRIGLSSPEIQAALDKLVADKHAEVLSRPSVFANDSEKAVVTIGQQLNFIRGFHTDPAKGLVPDLDTLTTGISLSLTPYVNKDDMVTLDLDATISSLTKMDNIPAPDAQPGDPNIQSPVIDRRSAKSRVTIKADETVMILMQPSKDGKVDVIFLTPHVVPANSPTTAPSGLP